MITFTLWQPDDLLLGSFSNQKQKNSNNRNLIDVDIKKTATTET